MAIAIALPIFLLTNAVHSVTLDQSLYLAEFAKYRVGDVTRDRERQENVFQELQHAIDYLDHAPAGFFSVDANGDIVYLNATLAGWLDYDLAQVGSGGLKLADIVTGDGAALLSPVAGEPGDVKTEVHDLDLKTRGAQVGYNMQFDRWVLGIEADFDGASINGTGQMTGAADATPGLPRAT